MEYSSEQGALSPGGYRALRGTEGTMGPGTTKIETRGLFSLMGLPPELRLKIYPHLLLADEDIILDSVRGTRTAPAPDTKPSRPSTGILQTCKIINEEGTPILYGQNRFIIYLTMEPKPAYALTKFFLLNSLRWSSITLLTSISFMSHTSSSSARFLEFDPHDPHHLPFARPARAQPAFTCTGADIMARFTPNDFRYSPKGPDEVMALSVSNWISIQVMKAMLSAFQREVEESMRGTWFPRDTPADDAAVAAAAAGIT